LTIPALQQFVTRMADGWFHRFHRSTLSSLNSDNRRSGRSLPYPSHQ
jgi:hypothetical protein